MDFCSISMFSNTNVSTKLPRKRTSGFVVSRLLPLVIHAYTVIPWPIILTLIYSFVRLALALHIEFYIPIIELTSKKCQDQLPKPRPEHSNKRLENKQRWTTDLSTSGSPIWGLLQQNGTPHRKPWASGY